MNRLNRRLKYNRLIQRVQRHAGFSTLFHESGRGVDEATPGAEHRMIRRAVALPRGLAENIPPTIEPLIQPAGSWLPEEADVSLPPAGISPVTPGAAVQKAAPAAQQMKTRAAAPVQPVHPLTQKPIQPSDNAAGAAPQTPEPRPEEPGVQKINTDDWARLHTIMERHEARQAAQPESVASPVEDKSRQTSAPDAAGNRPVIQRTAQGGPSNPPPVEAAPKTQDLEGAAVEGPAGQSVIEIPEINIPKKTAQVRAPGLDQIAPVPEISRPESAAPAVESQPSGVINPALEARPAAPGTAAVQPRPADENLPPERRGSPPEIESAEFLSADIEPPLEEDTQRLLTQELGLPPLETVWPVERTAGLEKQIQSSLQNLPRKPFSESAVELITPRAPRPVIEKPHAASPRPEPLEEARLLEETAEIVETPLPEADRGSEGSTPRSPRAVKAARPSPAGMIPTEIGPLPEDLWGLIGEPAPTEFTPAQREARRGTEQQSADGAVVQRMTANTTAPQAAAVTPPVTGPAEHGAQSAPRQETTGPAPRTPAPNVNVDELARQVYQEIRTKLQVEWERLHRRM